jgi:hypothetical protein
VFILELLPMIQKALKSIQASHKLDKSTPKNLLVLYLYKNVSICTPLQSSFQQKTLGIALTATGKNKAR